MADNADQEKVLQVSLDELRRKYGELTSSYDQQRAKVLAFIAGELTLVAFLFASGITIPQVLYGLFFFLVGVGCIAASFVILTLTLRTAEWYSPGNSEASQEQNYLTELERVCEDYSSAIEADAPICNQRGAMFDNALMLLFIGVTILLVIKYGQGEVQWHNIIQKQ